MAITLLKDLCTNRDQVGVGGRVQSLEWQTERGSFARNALCLSVWLSMGDQDRPACVRITVMRHFIAKANRIHASQPARHLPPQGEFVEDCPFLGNLAVDTAQVGNG